MRDKRSIYLNTISIPEAIFNIKKVMDIQLKEEVVPTHMATHRITSRPVYAKYSSPTYHSAAMDGICVRAKDTFGAREGNPIKLKKGRDFQYVNTGYPIPKGFDAVIMIEYVQKIDDEYVSIEKAAYPYEHVRKIGEDIVATEMIIPQNHQITPYDIGALLSGGIYELFVKEKVKISIIPTGDEVLDFELKPKPGIGQVIESNSMMLKAMAEKWGCIVKRIPPVEDDLDKICEALCRELESDAHIVVIGAGSSAGDKDYSRRAMERFGEVIVHGISAMPGKPSILGFSHNKKLMVGAPGYPVSSVICFEKLLKPLIYHMVSIPMETKPKIQVMLNRRVPSKLGQREFIRVAIARVGKRYVANPLKRGASQITTLVNGQGIIEIPENVEGIKEGSIVDAELLVDLNLIENTLMCVGSHDNILDLIKNELMKLHNPIRLSSSHVGSVGGLVALNRGSCHFAGSHLYDPDSGDYNFPFIKKYIPDKEVVVVNLAIRHQGFMVKKGNPKGIYNIKDLIRKDVVFVNRQKGSGTRILFDDLLKKNNISPEHINGYDREEFTHMEIGVNVLSGTADVGMGIYAAAKALGLDFIEVARERYDLVILKEFLEDPKIKTLLEIISSDSFKAKIEALGGYETTLTGHFMKPGMGL